MLETTINLFRIYFQGALLPALLMGIWVWKADQLLSNQGAAKLFAFINNTTEDPSGTIVSSSILGAFERHFNINKSPGFFLNVLYLTLISILATLLLYSALFAGGNIFQRQALLQMFPLGFITFWTNIFTFLIYPSISESIAKNSLLLNAITICADIGIKCILFIAFYGIYYMFLADFGPASSIGACSYTQALGFVPTILIGALKFQNFSSVFLYSLLFASFPIYLVFFVNMIERHKSIRQTVRFVLYWLPFNNKPLRVIGVLFAISLGTFALIATFLLRAIPHEVTSIIC